LCWKRRFFSGDNLPKSLTLFIALLLLTLGWAGAFLLGGSVVLNQNYWLFPALAIGIGIGLCLRFIRWRKIALLLALTAIGATAVVNSFFPDRRISLTAVRGIFSGKNPFGGSLDVQVDPRFKSAPFDQPMILTSPVSLHLSVYTRLPAGVEDFCFSAAGALFASLPDLGAIYRVDGGEGRPAATPQLFLHGLDNPSGLLCAAQRLLVAESSQVQSYAYEDAKGKLLLAKLPDDGGQLAHRLQFVPEGLLVSVGSRCDACEEKNPLRGTIQVFDSSGILKEYTQGLRNIGALAFDEKKGQLWATENSRTLPAPGAADELNLLLPGTDYGWPNCAGLTDISVNQGPCAQRKGAALLLLNRANPKGLMLTANIDFPEVYRSSLLVVLQGEPRNNFVPAVARIPLSDGRPASPVAFLGGWDGETSRPSAIHAGPDGAVYIADEVNGAIYRVAWQGEN
jgi:glucose/arabinose dehydrogenase